jgi:hypothetical protein
MWTDRDDIDDVGPAPPPAYFYTGPRKDVVVLTADEAKDDLPAVCLCCGAPATVWKRKLFAVNEVGAHIGTGIGALIALIFILVDVIRVPVGQAHSKVRYLRLKRLDTDEMLILPITREQLAREPKHLPERGYGWNGTAKEEDQGLHLGIIHGPRWKWSDLPKDAISLLNDGWDGFTGSGFGHKVNVGDKHYYCWQDREIPKTTFEIAVTAEALTEEERRHRVK